MTDRINSVTVVFDRDIRDDDIEPYLIAIRMIKGVISVTPNIVDSSDYVATMRARDEYRRKIYDAIKD